MKGLCSGENRDCHLWPSYCTWLVYGSHLQCGVNSTTLHSGDAQWRERFTEKVVETDGCGPRPKSLKHQVAERSSHVIPQTHPTHFWYPPPSSSHHLTSPPLHTKKPHECYSIMSDFFCLHRNQFAFVFLVKLHYVIPNFCLLYPFSASIWEYWNMFLSKCFKNESPCSYRRQEVSGLSHHSLSHHPSIYALSPLLTKIDLFIHLTATEL